MIRKRCDSAVHIMLVNHLCAYTYPCLKKGHWTTTLNLQLSNFLRYNEVCHPGYNFNKGHFSSGTRDFTQVVWKNSTVLGMGQATGTKNDMQCTYIVARYKPAGNFIGEFKENVPKGGFNAAAYCASVDKRGHWSFTLQRQQWVFWAC